MNDKLIWTTVQKSVKDLLPNSKNPRKISDKQMSDLKKSLEKYNLVEIPAIDTDGTIVAGHQRIKALQLLGRENEIIDVRIPNRKLTQDEAESYMIASNALGGDWDFTLLKNFKPEFLIDVGFDITKLSNFWDKNIKAKDEVFKEKEELENIKEPNTKTGDLIILGEHRLVCGDSNDSNVLRKLFGDERASMVISDPLYNINLDYRRGVGGRQDYGVDIDDNKDETEYIKFLRTNIQNALSFIKDDCHVFYWNTEQQIWMIQTLFREAGIVNKRVCLWVKNGQNPTPQVAFSKCYEPCIYGTIGKPYLSEGEVGQNEVLNKELSTGNDLVKDVSEKTNLWAVKRIKSQEYEHATSKPVNLYEKPIKRCTKLGDVVLDTFAGSGSIMIAGEQLGRKIYMVEKEPVFCDLIIKRYENFTSKKAKIIRD